jgi:hypothetical protein
MYARFKRRKTRLCKCLEFTEVVVESSWWRETSWWRKKESKETQRLNRAGAERKERKETQRLNRAGAERKERKETQRLNRAGAERKESNRG